MLKILIMELWILLSCEGLYIMIFKRKGTFNLWDYLIGLFFRNIVTMILIVADSVEGSTAKMDMTLIVNTIAQTLIQQYLPSLKKHKGES